MPESLKKEPHLIPLLHAPKCTPVCLIFILALADIMSVCQEMLTPFNTSQKWWIYIISKTMHVWFCPVPSICMLFFKYHTNKFVCYQQITRGPHGMSDVFRHLWNSISLTTRFMDRFTDWRIGIWKEEHAHSEGLENIQGNEHINSRNREK